MRYEALVAGPDGAAERLQTFRGIWVTPEQVAAVVARCSKPARDGRLHFKKGGSREFKTMMNPDQLAFSQQCLEDVLGQMGCAP